MARLGVRLDPGLQFTPQEMLELVSLAEERGYETIWLPEGTSNVLIQLTAFATATRHIKLGTGIMPIFHRTPTLLAMSAGDLDMISRGRFILGLGTGHHPLVRHGHGVPFRNPMTRMRETVEIVRRLLRGERVTYEGRVFKVKDASLGFTPVRPDTPIYLGALGPQMIELAGEIADGVLLAFASSGYLRLAVEHLRRGAERAGRNSEDIDVACYLSTAVVDDPDKAWPVVKRQIARLLRLSFYRTYYVQNGFAEESAAISHALDRGDADAAVAAVSEAMQKELAIVGSAEECRREVEARRSLGLKQPVVTPFPVGEDSLGSFKATISAFSE